MSYRSAGVGRVGRLHGEYQEDQLDYLVLEVVEAPDVEQARGGLRTLRRVYPADEQLVEAQREHDEDTGIK